MGFLSNQPGNNTEAVMGFGSVDRGTGQPAQSPWEKNLTGLGSALQAFGGMQQGGGFQPAQAQQFDVMQFLNSFGGNSLGSLSNPTTMRGGVLPPGGFTSLDNIQTGRRY